MTDTKNKIFLGGSYSADEETRKNVSSYAQRIKTAIEKCGFKPSLNLLTNEKIFDKTESAQGISFEDGQHFLKVGENILSSVKQKDIEAIRALRHFKSDEEFIIAQMACNIALKELRQSIAGIFELSAHSQGSYLEIGLMIFHYQKPVLALSHEDWGRKFGKMLTGLPSQLLKTAQYNDDNLEEIIERFLLKDLPDKKLKIFSYRVPVGLQQQIQQTAKEKGFKSSSEFIRYIVEEYLKEDN